MKSAVAISLQNVTFSYASPGGFLTVLREVSVEILSGQIVGLVGLNASGKSTLLNIIKGFLVPAIGTVSIRNIMTANNGKQYKRPKVSIISQRPDAALSPSMTLYENFLLSEQQNCSRIRWAYSKYSKKVCSEILKKGELGLEDKINEQSRFLSGGQQQAFSVLIALRDSEDILLLDEPTAALDAFAAKRVLTLAISEATSKGSTVLLVSHRISDILTYCRRLLILKNGMFIHDFDLNVCKLSEQELLTLLSNSGHE